MARMSRSLIEIKALIGVSDNVSLATVSFRPKRL